MTPEQKQETVRFVKEHGITISFTSACIIFASLVIALGFHIVNKQERRMEEKLAVTPAVVKAVLEKAATDIRSDISKLSLCRCHFYRGESLHGLTNSAPALIGD